MAWHSVPYSNERSTLTRQHNQNPSKSPRRLRFRRLPLHGRSCGLIASSSMAARATMNGQHPSMTVTRLRSTASGGTSTGPRADLSFVAAMRSSSFGVDIKVWDWDSLNAFAY